ncbi:hypothetical protein HMPREF0742_00545 [Rothia aeria F0184]|uniref:Uncharacterized protein n=1 Tax=Rothia aeria F0184 TaxID=888019 RepID=U7V8Q6_9MICC|nr:hypothetical protein HMPREF0742_00545 [Rothia aeria F0184]
MPSLSCIGEAAGSRWYSIYPAILILRAQEVKHPQHKHRRLRSNRTARIKNLLGRCKKTGSCTAPRG